MISSGPSSQPAVFERPLILITKPLHLLASAFSQTSIVLISSACMDFESATVSASPDTRATPDFGQVPQTIHWGWLYSVWSHGTMGLGTGYIMHG